MRILCVRVSECRPYLLHCSQATDRQVGGSRPLPGKPYPGVVAAYGLNEEEEHEWRRWTPKAGDVVLVDLPDEGKWPGKVSREASFPSPDDADSKH